MPSSPNSLTVSRLQSLQDSVRAEQERRQAKRTERFTRWAGDPVGFVENELLGFLWSKQREICESVVKHRFTAVKSCHSVGKTCVAARIGAYWLSVYPPGEAFLVTSAPTGAQVKALLWREINSVHRQGGLPGRCNQTEWIMEPNEIVGFGRSVKDTDPTAIQGVHARRVLVVFDEACGMSTQIWDAAETLVANEDSRFLAIGNPDDPASEFARSCKPGSGYNVIQIDAFESPNLTDEEVPDWLRPLLVSPTWVEERRRKWGEDSPLWKSKVRGDFPEQSADGLIPLGAVRAAVDRELEPGEDNELGVDVARFGNDKSVVFHRRGPVARKNSECKNRDLMEVTGMVVKALDETGATVVKVDDIGLGGGVTDRLRELRSEGRITADIVAINVSEAPRTVNESEKYTNLRADLNWGIRERFVAGDIDIEADDDLEGQAAEIKYRYTSSGKIRIEEKTEMKKRGLPSPDDWDALVLCFAPKELGMDMALNAQEKEFVLEPFNVPLDWPRLWAIDLKGPVTSVVWVAVDELSDTAYLYAEYLEDTAPMPVWASAIRARGDWIPGIFEMRARKRSEEQGQRIVDKMIDERLDVFTAEADVEAALAEIDTRILTKRLKVLSSNTGFLKEYRNYRRGRDGKVVEENDGLIKATGLALTSGLSIAMIAPSAEQEAEDEWADQTRNQRTGY